MTHFEFSGKLKTTLIGFMVVGLVCLVLSFFLDDQAHHVRFWSNFLHNSVYFTGIAFISAFFIAASVTAYAGWFTVLKRIWEAYSLFMIVGLVLMGIVTLGVWGHFHHLYHWAEPSAVAEDEILTGKSSFLNKWWFTFGALGFLAVWYFFARWIRKISLSEEESGNPMDFTHLKRVRTVSAIFLPIAAFSSAAAVWLWVMSVDAHWYSTLYAWYCTASWFVGAIALTILTVLFLQSRGYMNSVTAEHLHDLGKFMFAFSIFWTYLWFSQYMLIWYGNVGEETIYYHQRIHDYPVLFYGNLFLNFIIPFFVLMRNDNKRKFGTLFFTSLIVFFGHWWDFFQMIKPGTLLTAQESSASGLQEHLGHHASGFVAGFTIPGLLELGTLLGFLGLFLYFAFTKMTKAPLEAKNDPFFAESVHHHV